MTAVAMPIWEILVDAYSHDAKGNFRHAVATLVNGIDDLLLAEDYAAVDRLLRAANPRKLSTESIVAIMATTFAAAEHLKERASWIVCRAYDVLRSRHSAEEVHDLVAKYDA